MKSRLSTLGCVLILSALIFSGFGAAPVHTAGPGTYVVRPSDTLLGIAARYGLSVSQLARANGLQWNSWVYVGQRLTIPSSQPDSAANYIVRRGDTLYSIARRFGTTVNAVMAANNLRSTTIYVGQRLVIPGHDGIPDHPTVALSPTSGPSGTVVEVTANGFPPHTSTSVGLGLQNSEFSEVARGMTDANGRIAVQVPVQGAVGMNWIFGVNAGGTHTTSVPFRITGSVPTPISASAAERILFAPGATQTTVEGYLPANGTKVYVMGVAAAQFIELSATVGEMGQGLRFAIVGADGTVVRAMGEAHVRTVVPSTQDYYVELASDVGPVSYRMSVLIPVRIRFAPGTTSAKVAGRLATNSVRHYALRALAGQRMVVVPRVSRGQVSLVISGVDGQVLLSGSVVSNGYDGILPTTQDYLIAVRGLGETGADYTLEITIPPL